MYSTNSSDVKFSIPQALRVDISLLFIIGTLKNLTKYLVYRRIRRQGTVEDGELTLDSFRNIIPSSSRMNHGGDELNVYNVRELARLLQIVKPLLFHYLTYNLVCYLSNKSLVTCIQLFRERLSEKSARDKPERYCG